MKISYLAIAPVLALCTGFALNTDSESANQREAPEVQESGDAGVALMNGECFGCEAYTIPSTNPITVTGSLCGKLVGLRLTFNTIANGECEQTSPCGPTKVGCAFGWKLEYASRCPSFIGGNECGALIPTPVIPNPIAGWTVYLASGTTLNCGGSCTVSYSLSCQNCNDPPLQLSVTLACEPCIRF